MVNIFLKIDWLIEELMFGIWGFVGVFFWGKVFKYNLFILNCGWLVVINLVILFVFFVCVLLFLLFLIKIKWFC